MPTRCPCPRRFVIARGVRQCIDCGATLEWAADGSVMLAAPPPDSVAPGLVGRLPAPGSLPAPGTPSAPGTLPAPLPGRRAASAMPLRPTPFASLRGPCIALQVLFGVLIGAQVLHVVARMNELALLDRFPADPDAAFLDEANASDALVGTATLLSTGLAIATTVVIMIWLYRAVANERFFGATPRLGPGWAIGAWFVPVANLWLPKQLVNDAYRVADPKGPPMAKAQWQPRPVPLVVLGWWLTFILGALLNRISGIASRPTGVFLDRQDAISSLRAASVLALCAAIVFMVSALCGIFTVKRVTDRQHERAAALMAHASA